MVLLVETFVFLCLCAGKSQSSVVSYSVFRVYFLATEDNDSAHYYVPDIYFSFSS